ncbi:MAG: rhomboid family intramembrane serine protease [Pseudomonadota bacterium]
MIPLQDENPTRRFPIVTVILIAANLLVFLWQVSLGDQVQAAIFEYGFVPSRLFHPDLSLPVPTSDLPASTTLVSSMFLHAGIFHIGGNMLYLWIFGDNVEDAMGPMRFLAFYLLCGFTAAFGQALIDTQSAIPMIGASGAVSGALGAYILLHPVVPVRAILPLGFVFIPIVLPAYIPLGIWFGGQLLMDALSDPTGGGVAFRAHIAGFLAGIALIPFFKDRHVPLLDRRQGPNDGP